LLGLGDTITRSADPGATVNYRLDGILSTFDISSAPGASVNILNEFNLFSTLNLSTNGGAIGIGTTFGLLGAVNVTIDQGGAFFADGAVIGLMNSGSIVFSSGGGTAVLGTENDFIDLSFSPPINDLTSSADVIDDRALGFAGLSSYTVTGDPSGQQSVSIVSSSGTFSFNTTGSNLMQGTFSGATLGSGTLQFSSDGLGGTNITVCFAQGTHIATPDGEALVEDLRPGDQVMIDGPQGAASQPVKWVGRRRINLAAHPRPETVAPVRIARGAFSDNVPHRDLWLSPDHAVFVDGKLIGIRQLVNGTTIQQETEANAVEYYHVELEQHTILAAEGLPTESYLDTGNRNFFSNSDQPLLLHPNLLADSDRAARETCSCAPFVWDETSVRPVWEKLAARAAVLGQPVAMPSTTTAADLRVVAGDCTLQPISAVNGSLRFMIPDSVTEIRLVSRSALPTDTRPWLEDRRRLGVYLERIALRTMSGEHRDIPLDHPELSQGWWDVEHATEGLRRWTNGDAILRLPALDGAPLILEIEVSTSGMLYPDGAAWDGLRRAA